MTAFSHWIAAMGCKMTTSNLLSDSFGLAVLDLSFCFSHQMWTFIINTDQHIYHWQVLHLTSFLTSFITAAAADINRRWVLPCFFCWRLYANLLLCRCHRFALSFRVSCSLLINYISNYATCAFSSFSPFLYLPLVISHWAITPPTHLTDPIISPHTSQIYVFYFFIR